MKIFMFVFLFALVFSSSVFAQKQVPKFKDYAVKNIYTGKNAKIKLNSNDRTFRTRLTEASKEKVNFAGHYVLTAWGCGTTCLMGAVIDVKTGKVYWWNFSICCWGAVDEGFNPIEFRENSNLIIFSGNRNEQDGDYGSHFYKFENGKFTHIKTVPRSDGI